MFHVEQLRRIFRIVRNRRFKYSPLISAYIYKSRILENFAYFASISNLKIAPVLKSNAYGHDLVKVAKILKNIPDIPFLVIDNYYESLVLENEGIGKDLLVIGYTGTENILSGGLKRSAFTVGTIEQLQEISKKAKKEVRIHLKFDTGMNRQGIAVSDLRQAVKIVSENKSLQVEGVCSHLADPENDALRKIQKSRWNEVVTLIRQLFDHVTYFHILATSGIFYCHEFYSNVARIGIGIYGFDITHRHTKNIKPVLSLRASISAIKAVKKDELIGYNGTFRANKDMRVAIVPVGYYEGIDRRLSNNGYLKINNKFCPLAGLVSMNICTVDVSDIAGLKQNDEVVVISEERDDLNSVERIARQLDCTPYEVLVRIPQHLRRVVV